MAASYPASAKSFTPIVDGVDYPQATQVNQSYDEITAVEQALLTTGLAHNLTPDSSAGARTLGSTSKFWGLSYLKGIALAAAAELTVASGAITATQSYHKIDTESDAAADDLDTITAGSGIVEGSVLVLRAENVARVVTLKDGTGNLLLQADYALSATDRTITLIYDGTNFRELARSVAAANPVRVLDRDITVQDVANTTTETGVYSFSVPAGTLGSTKALRLTVIADYLNDSGGSVNTTFRVKFGSTTIFSHTANPTTSASRRAVRIDLTLSARNATNAQASAGWLMFAGTASGVTGSGSGSTPGFGAHTGIAEDSTGSLTFSVTVQHDAASANVSCRCQAVVLEVLE